MLQLKTTKNWSLEKGSGKGIRYGGRQTGTPNRKTTQKFVLENLRLRSEEYLSEQERVSWMSVGKKQSGQDVSTDDWEAMVSIEMLQENPDMLFEHMMPHESTWSLVETAMRQYGPRSPAQVDVYGRHELGYVRESRLIGGTWANPGYNDYVLLSTNHGTQAEHRVIAEKALGKPLPKNAVVHHIDEHKSNNANNNLVICQSQGYHKLLHLRMQALKECGNHNLRKCRFCNTYDSPEHLKTNGITAHHTSCRERYN